MIIGKNRKTYVVFFIMYLVFYLFDFQIVFSYLSISSFFSKLVLKELKKKQNIKIYYLKTKKLCNFNFSFFVKFLDYIHVTFFLYFFISISRFIIIFAEK